MGVGEPDGLNDRVALFSRATIVGLAVVALAALSDGDIPRSWIFVILGVGATTLSDGGAPPSTWRLDSEEQG